MEKKLLIWMNCHYKNDNLLSVWSSKMLFIIASEMVLFVLINLLRTFRWGTEDDHWLRQSKAKQSKRNQKTQLIESDQMSAIHSKNKKKIENKNHLNLSTCLTNITILLLVFNLFDSMIKRNFHAIEKDRRWEDEIEDQRQ